MYTVVKKNWSKFTQFNWIVKITIIYKEVLSLSRVLALTVWFFFLCPQLISSLFAGWLLGFNLSGRTTWCSSACVGAVRWGEQRGEPGHLGLVGGHDVDPFKGEVIDLSPELFGLLRLYFHLLLKPLDLLLVHAAPVILELSALDTHKQTAVTACSGQSVVSCWCFSDICIIYFLYQSSVLIGHVTVFECLRENINDMTRHSVLILSKTKLLK